LATLAQKRETFWKSYLQLDPARPEASAPLVAPSACAAAMMAFACWQFPLRAADLAALGALRLAAWVHCAFLAASVQREKLTAAPEMFPLLAAAMQASHA
jgi:hypothetical protein